MSAPARSTFALTALLLAAWPLPAADEGLSKVEISKLGKTGTALVDLKSRRLYAAAFCVHPSGLFVAHEPMVALEGQSGTVLLVVDPGLKTEKTFKAKVIRSDKELGLALLRAEGAKDLAALALGTDDHLTELAELIAFGFPPGPTGTPDQDTPSIQVNVVSVSSLQKKGGALYRLQLEGALRTGHVGGPLLDKTGKVAGVVVGATGGAGNFAVPASHVTKFLARPDVQFTPPALTRENMFKPVTFEARAAAVLPSKEPFELELALKAGDGPERKHRLEPAGDVYRVTAAPVPRAEGGGPSLRLTLQYDNGAVSAETDDRAFKVGGKEVRFSEVRSVQFKPGPAAKALLHDGKTLEGAATGLDAVPVRLGGQTVPVNLAKAAEVRFQVPAAVEAVAYVLTVRQGGKEVARLADAVVIRGAAGDDAGEPVKADVKVALADGDKEVQKLPSPVGDVAVGGGGRFLLLHLPKVRKLAVFDADAGKVVQYLTLAEDAVKFAAGQDKLILAYPSSKVVQRWSLNTFEREETATLPVKDTVRVAAMGSASAGPVLVAGSQPNETFFLDLKTLKPLDVRLDNLGQLRGTEPVYLRASADGTVFSLQSPYLARGACTIVLSGNEAKTYHPSEGGGQAIPGPDGRYLYTSRGPCTREWKAQGRLPEGAACCLPAQHGSFYLSLKANDKGGAVAVHLAGEARQLLQLTGAELPANLHEGDREGFTFDKRILFLPNSKLLVTIPGGADRLVLHKFDVEQALKKAGADYLLVTSQPPPAVKWNETYTYQLSVRSSRGGHQYKLEAGPKGMEVSPEGQVRWRAPTGFGQAEHFVIVSVRDAKEQEVFHTFTVTVKE